MRICGSADLRIFKRVKCGWFCGFFFADVTGKMRMRTQYYKLKAKSCIAGLVKIQGHTGIVGNERAESEVGVVIRY